MKLLGYSFFWAIVAVGLLAVAEPALAVCGDGVVDTGEDCDDGDTEFVSGDACSSDCLNTSCGQTTGSGGELPIATDALFALRSVVGLETCDPCVCDTDASGEATAPDVLRILAAAVGQDVSLQCLACSDLLRQGTLTLIPIFLLPEEIRTETQNYRADLEGAGYVLAEDASTLSWPERPARGWFVTMGDEIVPTDASGGFTLSVAQGEPAVGSIAHPQQPDVPLFELRMDQLSRVEDEETVEFEFELEFAGPCGMDSDPSLTAPADCAALADDIQGTAAHRHDDHGHAGHDHTGHGSQAGHGSHAGDGHEDHDAGTQISVDPAVRASNLFDPEDGFREDTLGTYPLANQTCCEIFDGIGTAVGLESTSTVGVLLNYSFSTCSNLVDTGCCAGELGSFKASALKKLGLMEPVGCKNNHKGRYCQELSQGDVSVQTPSGIAFGAPVPSFDDLPGLKRTPSEYMVEHEVSLGDRVPVTCHNNGCFGQTLVKKIREEIFGILTGDSYVRPYINHFSDVETYVPDRELIYAVPECTSGVDGDERDVYNYWVDGSFARTTFKLKNTNLWRCKESGSVFSGDNTEVSPPDGDCEEYHLKGANPCTGEPAAGGCGVCEIESLAVCGNENIEIGEDCETNDDSACPGMCENCQCPGTVCGNGVIEAGEECDGAALGAGCDGGVCFEDCTCAACGNNRIDTAEDCDGTDLGGKTCEDFDLVSGTLACNETCGIDLSGCEQPAGCGDGTVDEGEQCDSNDFYCHGGTCGGDCECSNACVADEECGADKCLNERCVTPCDMPTDCDSGESCSVPGLTVDELFQPGCTPFNEGGAGDGTRCESGNACASGLCYGPSEECTSFCYLGAGGDEMCAGGACIETIQGTNYGFCGTHCESEADCDADQACQLVADTSEDEYSGACGVNFDAGQLGDSCGSNSECDNFLCFTPPAAPGFCSTNGDCGSDAFCTAFFVCAQPLCTEFCTANADCGPEQPVCRSIPFPSPLGDFSGSKSFCAPE